MTDAHANGQSGAVITDRPGIPELLAPAGSLACARAAVENGADAVYFGLDVGFNARARAANISLEELPELIRCLHARNVRGYVTLNTLVFTDELPRLEENVRRLVGEGVDAVLVQDLGVARLIREISPDWEIHASTQMTLTHPIAIDAVRALGIDRVVLARELSLDEIREITRASTVPVEVFVHGALCVAYSGQCLTSESLGGRSANRGQCAQACRLPYELLCDGQDVDLGDVRYLLSPQDLAAIDLIPQLTEAGVCSLKIEGRLKTPEYVANITRQYRRMIDAVAAGRTSPITAKDRRDMAMSFSRGFSPGWLEGCDHKRLVPGRSSAKRGVLVGTVYGLRGRYLELELTSPLALGAGIVLEGDRAAGEEIGGRIYELRQRCRALKSVERGRVAVSLGPKKIPPHRIRAGQQVWQTDDPKLTKRLRATFSGRDPQLRLPVDLAIRVCEDEPTQITIHCQDRPSICLTDDHRPAQAMKHPTTAEHLREHLGRFGNTVYQLSDLNATILGTPMIPLSVLGQIRRRILALLDAQWETVPRPSIVPQAKTKEHLERIRVLSAGAVPDAHAGAGEGNAERPRESPQLHILCRSLRQLATALAESATSVIADFADVRQYADAVREAHASGAQILLASLRIQKPGEDGLLRKLARHGADGWLVRNLVALDYARRLEVPFVADFSLNVTNPLTAEELMSQGATRITASYDLNRDQLLELVAALPPRWLEVVIHQHMPMFHMEHCVFCAVLSPGTNKTNCGRPCDHHDVQLRDHVGTVHTLHADIGCRNTLYNGIPQSGAEAVASLLRSGVRHFRVEMLRDEECSGFPKLLKLYRDLLAGRIDGKSVWQILRAHNRVGVTRGTMEQPRDPLAIL